MTIKQQELLSAFVDGELNEQELDELLALMKSDDSAKQDYMRYQFSSDLLHGYVTEHKQIDLTDRIQQALSNEPGLDVKPTEDRHTAKVFALPDLFWKQTAGLAAAASIGALAVVGLMSQPQTVMPTTNMAQSEPMQQQTTVADSNRWTVGESEVEDRLNDYLVDHNEYAGASGLFSYARVVSYGEE